MLALTVFLGLIVVGAFVALFDANEYKQELSALVKQQTGRDLQFSGDIALTLYPALGMRLGSMSFSNAPGFGESPMLLVNNASVSVDVLSLLALKPQIAQLVLDGLQLNLQKNAQGQTNWDDLAGAPDKQPAPPSAEGGQKDADKTAAFNLEGAFEGLSITNSRLVWSDAIAGAQYQVEVSSLTTGLIKAEQPFPVNLSMAVASANELNAQLELTTSVLFENQSLHLTGLKLESKATGALIPVDHVAIKLGAEITFSMPDQRLGISALNTQIRTTGGVLTHSETSLTAEAGFDLKDEQLSLGVLDIQSDLQGDAIPNGRVKLGVSAARLELELNKRALGLHDLVFALNENKFQGFVQVEDYTRPAVRFELAADRFDVDKLLGVSDRPEPVPADKQEPAAEDMQIALPMDLLRTLKLDGKLSVGTLIVQHLTLNDILLKVNADKGILKLNPFRMNLYEGTFDSAIELNAQGKQPVYTLKQELSSFKIGKFLKDFMEEDMLSGATDLRLNLSARGEWLSALKASLNGDLDIALKDGAVQGFNLRHKIDSARARLKGDKEPELIEKKTDFSAMSLSAQIRNGVLTSDDLDMQTPLLRVSGKGSVDLVKETLNYLVNAKLVTTLKGQQAGTADELSGLKIPLLISGPWLSPNVDLQLDEIFKARLDAEKEQLKQKLDKQKDALAQKLAAEKASLKAAQEKEIADKKAQLEFKKQQLEAEQKAELAARKKEAEDKARKKLEDKLKKLF